MDKHGKIYDVIVKEHWLRNGIDVLPELDHLTVWAEPSRDNQIRRVPGVSLVRTEQEKGKYTVYLDPRYDRQFVIRQIKADLLS